MPSTKTDIFPTVDPSKRALFPPKLLLESICFWPENRTILKRIASWVIFALGIFVEWGHVLFVIKNYKNLSKIVAAISTASTTFQALTKSVALYIYADDLRLILNTIWFQFWPVSVSKPKTGNKLAKFNTVLIITEVVLYAVGWYFGLGFLSTPLMQGQKVLPFESIYPFDATKSPIYEILYVMEWFGNEAFFLTAIAGHDYLFLGICSNIISQFVLLANVTNNLGNGNRERNSFFAFDDRDDAQLLQTCVEHHVLLIATANNTKKIFGFTFCIQLFSSVLSLCVGALVFTFIEPDVGIQVTASSYMLGHLTQLFQFCFLGNELIYCISLLPDAIFASRWYNCSLTIKKNIILVIKQAQREVKMSVLDIKTIDMNTFIEIVRLSFSFYTMLSQIEKHNN